MKRWKTVTSWTGIFSVVFLALLSSGATAQRIVNRGITSPAFVEDLIEDCDDFAVLINRALPRPERLRAKGRLQARGKADLLIAACKRVIPEEGLSLQIIKAVVEIGDAGVLTKLRALRKLYEVNGSTGGFWAAYDSYVEQLARKLQE